MAQTESLALQGQRQAARALARCAEWLVRLPAWIFIAVLMLATAGRIGIGFYGNYHTVQNAHAFPSAYDYTSAGITAGLVYRLLSLNGFTWFVLTAAVVFVAAMAPVLATWRRSSDPSRWRLALLVMLGWQALPATSQLLGDYQSLLLLFVSLGLVLHRWWVWSPMLALAALSGPEPAAVGFACLLIGTWAPVLRRWRTRAVTGLCLAVGWFALSAAWLAGSGVESRSASMLHDIVPTLTITVAQGVIGIYAMWGPWWILVGMLAVLSHGRGRLTLVLAAVILPVAATALTWDGTRVFVCVSAPIGLAMAISYLMDDAAPAVNEPEGARHANLAIPAVSLWVVALLLMPPVVSNFGPGYRSQWSGPLYQVAKHLGHGDGLLSALLGQP